MSKPAKIQINHLYFIRGNKHILKEINFSIKANENWALVGLNGSGKSSLVSILSGYEFPTSGQVQVLGETFGKTSIPKLRRRIGLVSNWLHYQIPNHETVLRTIISGHFASFGIFQPIPSKIEEKAINLLEKFNWLSFKNRPLNTLSQGEEQVVLILRALMTDPELLILDEPTNGLDLFAKEYLLDFLQTLNRESKKLSLLFISHHLDEITDVFTHVALLKKGTLFKKGPTQNILTEKVLNDFYEKPVQVKKYQGNRLQVLPK